MSRIRHDAQVRLGPGLVQVPGAARGAHDVEAALHDDGRDVPDLWYVVEELRFALEPAAVDEVVALDAREFRREFRIAEAPDVVLVQFHVRQRSFPDGPGTRRLEQ